MGLGPRVSFACSYGLEGHPKGLFRFLNEYVNQDEEKPHKGSPPFSAAPRHTHLRSLRVKARFTRK